jgi:polyphosphate glucokinase
MTRWGQREGTTSLAPAIGNDSAQTPALSSPDPIRRGMKHMNQPRTLAIDIGGSGIKAALLDTDGSMIGKRQRVPTPAKPVAPEALVGAIDKAASSLGDFERVSVGFPGYVRDGRVLTAPNLGSDVLAGFDLQSALARHWGKPVRVLNDADVQGFGAIKGRGVEMVLTLGTGAGTAIFRDGEIMTHLELAHHPVSGGKTYDEYIGNAARGKKGRKTWNKRVAKVIDILREVVRFDHLYLGGGNAKDIAFVLPSDVTIVPNTDGLTGGIRLWRERMGSPAANEPPPGAPDQASANPA